MDRRSFIVAASAAPIAAIPALAAQVGDQHRTWLEEWREARAAWRNEIEDTPEERDYWDKSIRLEDLLYQTPARTTDGALAQLEWVLEDSKDFSELEHYQALRLAVETIRGGLV